MHTLHLVNQQATAAGAHGAAMSGFAFSDLFGIVAVLAIAIGTVLFAAFLVRRQDPRDDGDGDSGWGRGRWGRGGPGGPPWSDDDPLLPHGDPVWWPEFERQFAAYVGRRVGSFDATRGSTSIRASATDKQTRSHPR